jgi:hypothetical protein
MMENAEILMLSLVGLCFLGFTIHILATIIYLSSDRPLIAERLRRYGSISVD